MHVGAAVSVGKANASMIEIYRNDTDPRRFRGIIRSSAGSLWGRRFFTAEEERRACDSDLFRYTIIQVVVDRGPGASRDGSAATSCI